MPCGKLALGQNSTEIMSSDKSNSAAMFLQIQTDIFIIKVCRKGFIETKNDTKKKRIFKRVHIYIITVDS